MLIYLREITHTRMEVNFKNASSAAYFSKKPVTVNGSPFLYVTLPRRALSCGAGRVPGDVVCD